MPLVYQQNINPFTRLGVWHITEEENFFITSVPLQRVITHPKKRLQHLAGRLLLKELFPGFPYELIKIADTRKPFLENEAYHFSISHCDAYAAVVVSSYYRVGIDIEKITAKVENIRHKFLSAEEQQRIDELQHIQQQPPFTFLTAAWSIKESLFKWYGDGEIDFIDHLQIKEIDWQDNQGIAHCTVSKTEDTALTVHCLLFNNNCLSWILSEP